MVIRANQLIGTILVLACAFLPVQALNAEEPKLELRVSPTAGTQSDIFEFSVIVHGAVSSKAFPYLKGGDDFRLTLIGPQTSYEFINGQSSQRTTYVYNLFPKRTGLLKTPGAEIELPDRTLSAAPLSVPVTKAAKEDVMSRDKATFFVQQVTANKVFVGEQIATTLQLYSREDLRDLRVGDLTTKGMLQLPLGNETHTSRVIEGKRYRVTTLKRALFPLEPGTFVLPEREISGTKVVSQQRTLNPFDPFSGFFGRQQAKQFRVLSNTESVEVQPLPDPKGEVFNWNPATPLVGTTSLLVSPDPRTLGAEMEVGDDRTVTVKITSSGNLSSIDSFSLGSSPLIDVYAETPTERQFQNSGLLFTEKTYRFSLVAHSPGYVSLPPVRLTYFDPDSNEYRTLEKGGISFTIAGEPMTRPDGAASRSLSQGKPVETQVDELSPGVATPLPPQPEALGQRLHVSPSLFLFYVLASVAGLFLTGSLFFLVSSVLKRKRELLPIKQAENLGELLLATQQLTEKRLRSSTGPYVPLEELIRSKKLPTTLAFSLLEFLSLCKRLWYSGTDEGYDLRALRSRAQELLKKLP